MIGVTDYIFNNVLISNWVLVCSQRAFVETIVWISSN